VHPGRLQSPSCYFAAWWQHSCGDIFAETPHLRPVQHTCKLNGMPTPGAAAIDMGDGRSGVACSSSLSESEALTLTKFLSQPSEVDDSNCRVRRNSLPQYPRRPLHCALPIRSGMRPLHPAPPAAGALLGVALVCGTLREAPTGAAPASLPGGLPGPHACPRHHGERLPQCFP